MSEPAAIIMKVCITEKDYKPLLERIKVPLARCIFNCLQERSDHGDFYLFKYYKKIQVLYGLSWFNYGDDVKLEETEEWAVFQNAMSALPATAQGYCIGTYWATTPDDTGSYAFSYRIKDGQLLQQRLSPHTLKEVEQDADTFIFEQARDFSGFKNSIFTGKLLDQKIGTALKQLQQEFIFNFQKKNLSTATFRHPFSLGELYYYNGSYLYTFLDYTKPKIFDGIDMQSLLKTSYGFRNNHYAIVSKGKIPLNGSSLKVLKKGTEGGGTTYYLTEYAVYDENTTEMPEADPATFRLLNIYLAEDKNHLYINGWPVDKKETGAYILDDSGFYRNDVLLIGDKQLWMGSGEQLIDIDAATFKTLNYDTTRLPKAGSGNNYLFLRKCKDKHGAFFMYRTSLSGPISIDRKTSFEIFLTSQKTHFQSKTEQLKRDRELQIPRLQNDSPEELYGEYTSWYSSRTEEKLNRYKYDPWFYDTVNDYIRSCRELYALFKDQKYLNEAKVLYETLQEWCWLKPEIFRQMSSIYATLNLKKEAEQTVVLAYRHRYELMTDLLNHPDLHLIENETLIIEIKKHVAATHIDHWFMITAETLSCFEETIPGEYKHNIAGHLLEKYAFWDKGWILNYIANQPGQKKYFEKWQKMNDSFIKKYLFITATGQIYTGINSRQYYRYMHFELLNPLIHLDFIERKFHDAHMARNEDYIEKAYEAIHLGTENLKKSMTVWKNEEAVLLQVQNSDMWQLLFSISD